LLDEPEQISRELEEFLSRLLDDHLPAPLESPGTDGSTFVAPNRSVLEEVSRQVIKDAITARTLGGTLANDKEIRFLYFNKMNLAIKAQLGSTTGKGGITMGSDMALSLLDIKQDFDRYNNCLLSGVHPWHCPFFIFIVYFVGLQPPD